MREAARTFRDLWAWQKAHHLTVSLYQLTSKFPRHEIFGLASQLRRSAVSVPANIAEGFKRFGKPEKIRFLNIAQASLEECRYYLILTNDLSYGDTKQAMSLLEETSRFLDRYIRTISASQTK